MYRLNSRLRVLGLLSAAACVMLAAAASAAPNTGSLGFGFNCDVNTNKCTCTGTWDGADCSAMSKNCKGGSGGSHSCRETEAGVPIGCDCKMGAVILPNTGNTFGIKNLNGNLNKSP